MLSDICLFFMSNIFQVILFIIPLTLKQSTANVMLYVRGHKCDYDRWASMIDDDKFKYENVLPFFKKSQNATNYGSDEYVGRDGFLQVSQPPIDDYKCAKFCQAFIDSGSKMLGREQNADFNGEDQEGFGVYACTVRDGVRNDTGRAFIRSLGSFYLF